MLEQILKKITAKPSKKLTAKKPDEDLIPYVCHYNKDTILTKNGELAKIIRVTGLANNNMASDLVSLRDSIRDAIYDYAKDDSIAFWFHTIRRKKSLVINDDNSYQDFFSRQINEKWVEENSLENQFINEFYITILSEGLDTSITDSASFAKSFSYKTTQEFHKFHLEESREKLDKITTQIFVEIQDQGARILGLEDIDGALISQPMRFFGKLINLKEENYPLSINDISSDLASHKIAFGNREIEVVNKEDKNFASIFSIKEYHEVSVESLDKILNLPFEFIITQSFDFSHNESDLGQYKYNNNVLEISGDEDFRQLAGYKNFIESDTGKKNDYGKLQNSIMVIANSRDDLESDAALAVENFSELGFALVREDVFCEHCFWAQLPGNFSFLKRQKLINTLRVPGFAALHSFPSGSISQNHWGDAVSVLKTIVGSPYFFNFHEQDLGHSFVFGEKGSGKTVLTNFLLTQGRKFDNRIFYFDFKESSKCFINALSGGYFKVTNQVDDIEFLKMNPFSLAATEENAQFLTNWIKQLAMFFKAKISDNELIGVGEVVKKILNSDSPNFLTALDALKTPRTSNIYEKLKIWGSGKLSHIFGSSNEIDWQNPVIGFNLDQIINQKAILGPVIFYLFHKIETLLDGTKTVIVIDECFEFLDNIFDKVFLSEMLARLRQKNCLVIFNSCAHNYIEESEIAKTIIDNVATQIYLPNENPQKYYHEIFDLNPEEVNILHYMAQDIHRHALLKHASDSLIIDVDFAFYEELLAILSSDEITNTSMQEIFRALRQENEDLTPQNWIPQLIKILEEIKKQNLVKNRAKIAEESSLNDDFEFDIDASVQLNIEEDDEE